MATTAELETLRIDIGAGVILHGDLGLPPQANAIVVFAHGSGSSRSSPRNQAVAARLQSDGFATLLFDLLTADEETLDAATGHLRFDIDLLAQRLALVTDWIGKRDTTKSLAVGYFGASTGAAAALVAAANRGEVVRAIVSRGGRPDLAGEYLGRVRAPTLLIVGGEDVPVISMNQAALAALDVPEKKLEIVPGATHLFEEPGALERVADLAADWFSRFLKREGRPQSER